jgi:DNA-binding NarL/FixJ family response regulator
MPEPYFLVLDRHPLFRKGLCDALRGEGYACDEVDSFDELIEMLDRGGRPDLVLSDLRQSGCSNTPSHNYLRINCLRARFPKQRLMIVNDCQEPGAICSCIALGVSGCVLKSQSGDEIKDAVRTVLAGKTYVPPGYEKKARDERVQPLANLLRCLTGQESRVLMLVCDGLFNQQIADALGLREATVKAHVSQVLRKLSVPNRTNAVVMMERLAEGVA